MSDMTTLRRLPTPRMQTGLEDVFFSPRYTVATGAALALATLVLVQDIGWSWDAVVITTLLATTPLMLRRAVPWTACVAVAGAALNIRLLDGEILFTTAVGALVGLYTLARHRVIPPAVLHFVSIAAVLWAAEHSDPTGLLIDIRLTSFYELPVYTVTLLAGAAVVTTVSIGTAMHSGEKRRSAQEELRALEQQQAIETERATVAREVHDVVAHSVSLLAVQAESATYTGPGRDPEAREAFQQIAASARSSLTELRNVLGTLHPDRSSPAARTPQPTLRDIDELLDQHRVVGGSVELITRGAAPSSLPGSLELSVYRIIQEALTNARRHAPGAHTVVRLQHHYRELGLRINDDGAGPTVWPAPHGHGLVGMRERAASAGAELRIGPGPEGGFLIEGAFPLPQARDT